MIAIAVLLIIAGLGECQKGHYIRPLPEYRMPYRVPVFQEVSYSPRVLRPVYVQSQTEPRGRGLSRSQNLDTVQKADVKTEKPLESAYPILSYTNEMANDGTYSYKYETADGIMREESSVIEISDEGKQVKKVTGSYSYPSPDGRMIRVEYVADEEGFRSNQISEDNYSTYRRLGSNGFSYSFRAP
ncbi:larval cuticle protein LCP-30-like [Cimex lectularius]|uniref:CPR type cuticle protein n=1 Tax=Cimex lectularius TaxID=79782 RepID=A0A8I6RRR7_CIMLE|nr:larval cuticle protein LCP-30-like [Cimex lectularius]